MMEWIFDGIGTELIGLVIGAIVTGIVGYKICIKNRSKQVQKATNNAQQNQTVKIGTSDEKVNSAKISSKLNQVQKAGDSAVQTQIGGINNGK